MPTKGFLSSEEKESLQKALKKERRRTWTVQGKREKVKGQRRRGRVNMMGGLRYSDKKRICFTLKKGS